MNPDMQAMLAASGAVATLAWDATTDVATARAALDPRLAPPVEIALAAIDTLAIDVGAAILPARLYRPTRNGPPGATIFFHGGGWVVGTLDMYDFFCRQLARATNRPVLAVDYRLAPEHRYPGPVDDAFGAYRWVIEHAGHLGLDPARLAVAGDSAGGNLAAAVAILARDGGLIPPCHQMLLYPVIDADFERPSYVAHQEGFFLTRSMMRWFWRHYLGDRTAAEAPLAALLHTESLAGLPAATVLTAEYDPLRDEGAAYAQRLADAGVPTEYVCAPGMLHGFMTAIGLLPSIEPWFAYASARLRLAFEQRGR